MITGPGNIRILHPPLVKQQALLLFGLRQQRNEVVFSVSDAFRVLVLLAFAFFLLSGNARAQTITCPHPLPDTPEDIDVLKKLYCDTDGPRWTNKAGWGSPDLSTWHGVTITQGRVTAMALNNNNLTGSIPAVLGNLTSLTQLNLSNNELSGEIPARLGDLSSLTFLSFHNNELSGEIPARLGDLSSLTFLSLSSNELSGEIPARLGDLSSLTHLSLHTNKLTGTIPDLSGLTVLQRLHLQSNKLSGEVPAWLGNLSGLTHLQLHGNELSGAIPSELGSLSSLTWLQLHDNELSGAIPSELGNLSSLTFLNLSSNELSGAIPSELGNLTSLTELFLGSNELSGAIPSELGNLTSLTQLFLESNELTGTIPDLSGLTGLTWLFLNNNKLSGEIPAWLGSLDSLAYLYLSSNELSGEIPSELGSLSGLTWLLLNSNKLSGEIPSELGSLSGLTFLYLFGNQLTGTIPDLSGLTGLQRLLLHGNELSGTIPSELGSLSSLRFLYLHGNDLTGTIPDLSGLTVLQRLFLSSNQLSGNIPAWLSSLNNLLELSLWSNPDLAQPADSNLFSKIDRAALRFIYQANNGEQWRNKEDWLSGAISSDWYGVTLNDAGLVTGLNLQSNNLRGDMNDAFSGLLSLETLILSGNHHLTGYLPLGLMDLSGLTRLEIRCTRVNLPNNHAFVIWLARRVSFGRSCPRPGVATPPTSAAPAAPTTPLSPPPRDFDGQQEDRGDDGLAISPGGIGTSLIEISPEDGDYITIELSVEGDEEPEDLPSIILSSPLLERVETVTIHLSILSEEYLPENLSLKGFAAEVGLGSITLGEDETATVCLPTPGAEDGQDLMTKLYRYDGNGWEPLMGSKVETVNGIESVCAETSSFPSLFGVFLVKGLKEDRGEGEFAVSPGAVGTSVISHGGRYIVNELSVVGNEDLDEWPSIILSSDLLSRVSTISFGLSVPDPEELPSGSDLEGFAAQVGLGNVTLKEDESATVCLPAPEAEDGQDPTLKLYRYGEDGWEPLMGSSVETVNGIESVCAETSSLPSLFVVIEEEESDGGCSIASGAMAGNGPRSAAFNLLLIISCLLAVSWRKRKNCVRG